MSKLKNKQTNSTTDFTPIVEARDFIQTWYNDQTARDLYNQHVNQYEPQLYEDNFNTGWRRTNYQLLAEKAKIQSSLNSYVETFGPNRTSEYKESLDTAMNDVNTRIEASKNEYRDLMGTPEFKQYSQAETDAMLNNKINVMQSTPYGYHEEQQYVFPNGSSEDDYQNSIDYHNQRYNSNGNLSGLWDISNPDMTTYRSKAKAIQFKGHEDMHNMRMNEAEYALGKIFDKYNIKIDPAEGLSLLMTDRQTNSISPDDRSWDVDRVNELRKTDQGNGLLNKVKNSEAIVDIYNLISKADAPTDYNQYDVSYAKRGKKLIARRKNKLC